MSEVDIRAAAAPKSDQLNYEDVIDHTKTITVSEVIAGSTEQPIIIRYQGDNGRPYKPCKSMLRVLLMAWGDKGAEWAGKSMTLYGDPEVAFGGVKMGGLRISHLSGIDKPLTLSLTKTRGKRQPYTVKPLKVEQVKPDPEAAARAEDLATAIPEAGDMESLDTLVSKKALEGLDDPTVNHLRELYKKRRAELREAAE